MSLPIFRTLLWRMRPTIVVIRTMIPTDRGVIMLMVPFGITATYRRATVSLCLEFSEVLLFLYQILRLKFQIMTWCQTALRAPLSAVRVICPMDVLQYFQYLQFTRSCKGVRISFIGHVSTEHE